MKAGAPMLAKAPRPAVQATECAQPAEAQPLVPLQGEAWGEDPSMPPSLTRQ